MIPSNLTCPVCSSKLILTDDQNTLKCEKRHSYDIASSGYVNLLNPGKMNNFKSGDSKEMVKARTEFLNSGCYLKALEALNEIIKNHTQTSENPTLIDAGCGEGYYTLNIAKSCENVNTIGFDASKHAVEHAAKSAKRQNLTNRTFFSAANIFSMPVKDASCDILLNLFAPEAENEFLRVLKPNGTMIIGASGACHLYELKSVLYEENVRYNDAREPREIDGFTLKEKIDATYKTKITSHDMLMNLFTMTPYVHKTSNEGKNKLDKVNFREIEFFEITVDFNFFVYKK